jgi:hypothetical protein
MSQNLAQGFNPDALPIAKQRLVSKDPKRLWPTILMTVK